MQLTRDPSRADLLVDVSNVCSREVLGGQTVALSRLTRAVEVFEAWSTIANAHVFAVADNSLFRRLAGEGDRRQLREWVQLGLVEAIPGADERLLDVTELSGGVLMTWDRFEGHRDVYPWVQGDREHFVLVQELDGLLTIALRDMGVVSGRRVSERAEIDALKAAHLLGPTGRPDVGVLSRWWRCPEQRCGLFSEDHREGQPLPVREGGRMLCSLHRLQLVDSGPRQPQVQLKVLIDGRVADRVVIEQGQSALVIGRGPESDLDLTPFLCESDTDLVSRRHASIWLSHGALHVKDEGSTNGTAVIGAQGGIGRDLAPAQAVALKPLEGIRVAGVVTLEQSGRRFPVGLGHRAARRGREAGETRLQ